MKENTYPRIMIAGASSGSGKTTVTCALLKALKNRNLKVTAFKCGPDYIDPMFHSEVIGIKSRNLDLFFTDEETTTNLFCKNAEGSDISVMEGVMGFYDGLTMTSSKASSYEVSKVTKTPVILVLNCSGMAVSIIASIKGYLDYKPDNEIKGVILNNVSGMIYDEIKDAIEKELNIKAFGYLPNMKEIAIESRHLGLVTAKEIDDLEVKMDAMAEAIEKTVDLDGIIKTASAAPMLTAAPIKVEQDKYKGVKVAVAMDKAFCFYYEDNLELLRELGAEIIPFSPLEDKSLPKDINGIIIGGGYPEIYAEKLASNKEIMAELLYNIHRGMPIFAECGGFMYLHETLEDNMGNTHRMVGAIEGHSFKTNRLGRFGYIVLEAKEDNLLGSKGEEVKGHEFHFWDSTNNGEAYTAKKPSGKKAWDCIIAKDNLLAGYPHLHFYSNINVPMNFLNKCLLFKNGRE